MICKLHQLPFSKQNMNTAACTHARRVWNKTFLLLDNVCYELLKCFLRLQPHPSALQCTCTLWASDINNPEYLCLNFHCHWWFQIHVHVRPWIQQANDRQSMNTSQTSPEVEKFKCQHCYKEFAQKRNLYTHEKIKHQGIYPYYCSICGKGEYNKRDLSQHMVKKHGYVAYPTGKWDILLSTGEVKKKRNKNMGRGRKKIKLRSKC